MDIKTVTVIGANGTMGRNVAAIFAAFGNCKVYLICRSIEKAKETVNKSVMSVRSDSIANRLIPADYSILEKCVSNSDFILEQIIEDLREKQKIIARISSSIRKDAIVCTGTSGLSVTALAECLPIDLRDRFFGVHLFNPPYSLTLCELICTKYTDLSVKNELKFYLEDKLRRTVVDVKDSPAFLANRIGFQFINAALQYAEMYKDYGGIDYIDTILGGYSGRAMPPIFTADFVGLDVHKAIVDNIYDNTNDYAHDTFKCPNFVNNLINKGFLGKKSGGGVYQLREGDNGIKKLFVYDIASGEYREKINYSFPFAEKMISCFKNGSYDEAFSALIKNHSSEAKIYLELILKYIVYSLVTVADVGYDITAADDVMVTGFNWCPPLAMIEALSRVSDVKELIKVRLGLNNLDIDRIFKMYHKSRYDYRIYFKAKKY